MIYNLPELELKFLKFYMCFKILALPTSTSCLFSATLAVLTLAAMMAFKSQLAAKEWMTILGGFLGSQFFIFLVTVSSLLAIFSELPKQCIALIVLAC